MYNKNIALVLSKSFIAAKLFALLLVMASCTDNSDSFIDDGYQYVTFTVSTPYSSAPTYAISENSENAVVSIDVLAFRLEDGEEVYTYRARGEEIQSGSETAKKEFKVNLRKDEAVYYRFVVIANAEGYLDALSTTQNAGKSQLLARLVSKNAEKWNAGSDSDFRAMPMWGETKELMEITDAVEKISDITLLRSLAAIDVVVGTGAQMNFNLSEVYLYNRSTKGRIVPIADRFSLTDLKVTDVSMPLDSSSDPLTVWDGLGYTTSANELKNTIYTYEAKAASSDESATCVVVGGLYDGDKTYYRIDFAEKEGDAFTNFKPLLRNHRYTLNITSVTDDGYATADEAFYGKKLGITVEIEEWNMSDMAEVEVDENYFLKVSRGVFSLDNSVDYFGTVTVQTNHPDGWKASSLVSWISITSTGANYVNFKVAASSGGSREGSISIEAGNLTKKIKVTQP